MPAGQFRPCDREAMRLHARHQGLGSLTRGRQFTHALYNTSYREHMQEVPTLTLLQEYIMLVES